MSLQSFFDKLPKTIDDLLSTREYDGFRHDKLGNQLFLENPDRADRLYKYAEHGSDGSTHAEILDDYQEFLGIYFDNKHKEFSSELEQYLIEQEEILLANGDDHHSAQCKLTNIENNQEEYYDRIKEAIQTEIDKCIQWHIDNGSYDQIIG